MLRLFYYKQLSTHVGQLLDFIYYFIWRFLHLCTNITLSTLGFSKLWLVHQIWDIYFYSVCEQCCCLVTKSCPTLCDPVNCSKKARGISFVLIAGALCSRAVSETGWHPLPFLIPAPLQTPLASEGSWRTPSFSSHCCSLVDFWRWFLELSAAATRASLPQPHCPGTTCLQVGAALTHLPALPASRPWGQPLSCPPPDLELPLEMPRKAGRSGLPTGDACVGSRSALTAGRQPALRHLRQKKKGPPLPPLIQAKKIPPCLSLGRSCRA